MELKYWMRQLMVVAATFSVAMGALSGCSKQDGATPITNGGRDARISTPGGASVSASGIQLNGWVYSVGNQDLFQEAVAALVDATMPGEYLGFVSSEARGGTGVFLGGRVELQSGALNMSSTNANIRTDSKLLMVIYDEYTGRTDGSGTVVKPIPIGFARAEGFVRGNQVSIRFIDDTYGSVLMEGSFSQSVFRGVISFDNKVRYDGTRPGTAGTLGDFEVPTCQFFRCQ